MVVSYDAPHNVFEQKAFELEALYVVTQEPTMTPTFTQKNNILAKQVIKMIIEKLSLSCSQAELAECDHVIEQNC